MSKTMKLAINDTLYILEDATTRNVVAITTTIEALTEAFHLHSREYLGSRCGFYKLVDGKLFAVEDNELPEDFLHGYNEECDEYDDCAYCPACSHQW